MEHALQCLARLIRVLLGPTAVAVNKLACGRTLDVLGVDALGCVLIKLCHHQWPNYARQHTIQQRTKIEGQIFKSSDPRELTPPDS